MIPNRRLVLPVLLVLAIALIVAGCGGDSTSGGSSDAASVGDTAAGVGSLSKAAFVKQADAACAKGRKEVEAKFAAYLKKEKIEGIGASGESQAEAEARKADVVTTIGVPAYEKQIDEIGGLAPPAGDEATIEEFVEAAEEGLEKVEEEPAAVFDGKSKAFARADKIGQEYGFKVCANS